MPIWVRGCCRRVWGPSTVPLLRLREAMAPLRMTAFVWFALSITLGASAQTSPTVSYTIALTNPEQHLVDVQVTLPEGAAVRELQLPVWNALYQVRDFAQYVNWVRAK